MPHSQKNLYKKLLGGRGEKLACKFLKKRGMTLLEKNYRTPFGEIDLLMQDGEDLVFVEVKTRTGEGFGTASEAVTRDRRERYRRAALWTLKEFEREGEEYNVRFDVAEVYVGGIPADVALPEEGETSRKKRKKKVEIRHLPAAF